MQNTYTQTVLLNLPLPDFLLNFKNTLNYQLLPKLTQIITSIQKQQQNSLIVTLLSAILIFFVVRELIGNLFIAKPVGNKGVTQVEIDQEIRALGVQIKNLKNSLKRIIQQSTTTTKQQSPQKTLSNNHQPQKYQSEDINKLITYYKQAAQDFNNLAEYVLQTQETIFKELKNLKKLRIQAQKSSSHGSRDESYLENLDRVQSKVSEVQVEKKEVKRVVPQKRGVVPPPPVVPKGYGLPAPIRQPQRKQNSIPQPQPQPKYQQEPQAQQQPQLQPQPRPPVIQQPPQQQQPPQKSQPTTQIPQQKPQQPQQQSQPQPIIPRPPVKPIKLPLPGAPKRRLAPPPPPK